MVIHTICEPVSFDHVSSFWKVFNEVFAGLSIAGHEKP